MPGDRWMIGDEQNSDTLFFLFLNHKLFYNVKFKMPDSVDQSYRGGDGRGRGTMCGDLFCVQNKCARWVGGSFVKDAVTLAVDRREHLCWARHNGVRLLGGSFNSKSSLTFPANRIHFSNENILSTF